MSNASSQPSNTPATSKSPVKFFHSALIVLLMLGIAGCGGAEEQQNPTPQVSREALANRAYVVSLWSDELTVIDLAKLKIIGRVSTGGQANHMADVNADFSKVYVDSSETNETVVVDARLLRVEKRISVGRHPAHLSLSRDGRYFAVMAEEDHAVSFIDTERDVEIKRLPGFSTPHFMQFAPDGRYGYVANHSANHLTRVDLNTLEIDGHIAPEGFEGPPNATEAPDESGFADAQIDRTGILYAAHKATGRVVVYDTNTRQKLPEEPVVGTRPWLVFASHPFREVPLRHMVPSFGDKTVSILDGQAPRAVLATLPGDEEAYGVNYSSMAPNKAFVMNRRREDIAVVDTEHREIVERIPVGGNTETAATTPDGRWIVATVSSAHRVVVIDAVTNDVVKIFDGVGQYPWSVTIPGGQNYCH